MLLFKFLWKKIIRLQILESEVSIARPHENLMSELVFCRNGYYHSVLTDAEIDFMLQVCVATDELKYVDVALFTVIFKLYAVVSVYKLLVLTDTST